MIRRLHSVDRDDRFAEEVGTAVADDVGESERALAGPASVEQAALGGDVEAWAALIGRHNHKIVVALLARGIALEEARELAQETWLRLMQQQRTGKLAQLTLPGLAIVQAGYL